MYRVTFRLLETADEHFYPAYFSKISLAHARLGAAGESPEKDVSRERLETSATGAVNGNSATRC